MAPLPEKTSTAATGIEPMLPVPYRIAKLHHETVDTFTIELAPSDHNDSFSFLPGQFNMIYVFGVGEVPISISSDPRKPRTFQHTTRVVGSVSKSMGSLKKGDVL